MSFDIIHLAASVFDAVLGYTRSNHLANIDLSSASFCRVSYHFRSILFDIIDEHILPDIHIPQIESSRIRRCGICFTLRI